MSATAAMAAITVAAALAGGISDNAAARREARSLDESGRQSILAGEQEISATLHEERQVSGDAIAALSGSGVAVGTGSALDIIQQNAIQREVEVGNIRARARAESRNYRQAASDRRYAGKQALIGSIFQAAGAAASAGIDAGTQGKLDAQSGKERASRLSRSASILPGEHDQTNRVMWGEAGPFRRRRFGVLSLPGRG